MCVFVSLTAVHPLEQHPAASGSAGEDVRVDGWEAGRCLRRWYSEKQKLVRSKTMTASLRATDRANQVHLIFFIISCNNCQGSTIYFTVIIN